jgi:hypothetical protein
MFILLQEDDIQSLFALLFFAHTADKVKFCKGERSL